MQISVLQSRNDEEAVKNSCFYFIYDRAEVAD
jgi:hypothetical protein